MFKEKRSNCISINRLAVINAMNMFICIKVQAFIGACDIVKYLVQLHFIFSAI